MILFICLQIYHSCSTFPVALGLSPAFASPSKMPTWNARISTSYFHQCLCYIQCQFHVQWNNLSREILETLTELSDLGFLNPFRYQLTHWKLPTNIGTLHHLESITFHATISMVKYLQAWLH